MFETLLAQSAEASAKADPSIFDLLMLPLGLLIIMYFFVIRPQQKKLREQNDLLTNLKAGEEVVTSGGIIGRIKSVADTFVSLDVGSGTTLKIRKTNVSALAKPKTKVEPKKQKKK